MIPIIPARSREAAADRSGEGPPPVKFDRAADLLTERGYKEGIARRRAMSIESPPAPKVGGLLSAAKQTARVAGVASVTATTQPSAANFGSRLPALTPAESPDESDEGKPAATADTWASVADYLAALKRR